MPDTFLITVPPQPTDYYTNFVPRRRWHSKQKSHVDEMSPYVYHVLKLDSVSKCVIFVTIYAVTA